MKRLIFGSLAFLAGLALVTSPVMSQPPAGKDGKGAKGGKDGAKGGPTRVEIGQLVPPPLLAELKLTPEQEKEFAEIRTDVKAKLDKLLTAEQKKVIEDYKPMGAGGPPAKGGVPGEKGGKGTPPPKGQKGAKGGPGEKGAAQPKGDSGANGQDRPAFRAVEQSPPPSVVGEAKAAASSIQWYATLERGLAEAARTGKPILFVSGNPSCAGVSGMWCPGKGIIDRVYLSRPEVVAAASQFVCIRLTAYEDETERLFMSQLVRGEVSNTSFNILSQDGKPLFKLQGVGKGPGDYFKDAQDMAQGMDAIAARYPVKSAEGTPALPVALNAKVGLVIAAADNQPLVLVVAADASRRKELEAKVAEIAWNKSVHGQFVYATAASTKELAKVQGSTITDGVLVIEPDYFGSGGKVVQELAGMKIEEQLANAMREAAWNHVPLDKSRRDLAQRGLKAGIFYETGIPVSGKGEANDRDNYKKRLDQK